MQKKVSDSGIERCLSETFYVRNEEVYKTETKTGRKPRREEDNPLRQSGRAG